MWKPISGANPTGDWVVYDTMRGFVNATSGNGDARLRWNTSGAEQAYNNTGHPTATGVTMKTGAYGTKYVYIAIRRGPMAIPTQATDVFNVLKETSRNLNENPPYLQKTNWPVDVVTNRVFDTGSNWWTGNRLTHSRTQLDSPAAQTGTNTTHFWDYNNGVAVKGLTPASNFMGYHFRRAPHFFDVACYTGTGTAGLTVNHSLGVEPEMIWVKNRTSSSENWSSYWQSLGNTKILFLNKSFQALANSNYWNSTTPTDTQFTLGNYPSTNNSGDEFVAYLFASVDGVSKVGSYTGNGTSQTIDCGFTNGARYVLFKRTDASYEFVLFDSERGIVAGNDPFMALADANGQNSNFDAVDPNSSGFTVTGNWEGNNYSGSSYVFYAIA